MSEAKQPGIGAEVRRGAKFGAITGGVVTLSVLSLAWGVASFHGSGPIRLPAMWEGIAWVVGPAAASAALGAALFGLAAAINRFMNTRDTG